MRTSTYVQTDTHAYYYIDVMKSDSVMMQWELVEVELERERNEILLKLIVNEWITLRGFSFTTGLVELYKQANSQ